MIVKSLFRKTDLYQKEHNALDKEIASFHQKLSEMESAQRRATAAIIENKRKENELLYCKNIILQKIIAVELYYFFYYTTGLAFPTDITVDFSSLPECGDISQ